MDATRSKECVCSRSLARIAGSVAWIAYASVVNVVCCVGRGLCDGPIPRPGESRRVCVCVCVCVIECDQEQQSLSTPTMSR